MDEDTYYRAIGYIKAVRDICDACPNVNTDNFLQRLCSWWKAWEAHPEYDWYYAADSVVRGREPELLHPVAAGVFEHEPGRHGSTESYVIAAPEGILCSIEWGLRAYGGEFIGIYPIWRDIPVGKYRMLTISTSFKGAGGAMECRKRLKKLMPKKARPWISKARSANRITKTSLVKGLIGVEAFMKLNPIGTDSKCYKLPESYNKRTKAQIWMEEIVPPDVQAEIARFMELHDFWRCATGRVHPDQVYKLVEDWPIGKGGQLPIFGEQPKESRLKWMG